MELASDESLQRFCQYLDDAAERRSHIEYLELKLYDNLLRKRDRLLPLRVLPVAPYLYGLRELHLITHKRLGDAGLARLLAALPSLQALSLEHQTRDPEEIPSSTYADASPLYRTLARLPNLRTLHMERFLLPSLPTFEVSPPRLAHLTLHECIVDQSTLFWFTSGGR